MMVFLLLLLFAILLAIGLRAKRYGPAVRVILTGTVIVLPAAFYLTW